MFTKDEGRRILWIREGKSELTLNHVELCGLSTECFVFKGAFQNPPYVTLQHAPC